MSMSNVKGVAYGVEPRENDLLSLQEDPQG